jgi:prevent-host-death family protein
MDTIGAFEAKTHFSELLRQVESGESITITRHGRPVARLVGWDASLDCQTPQEKSARALALLKNFPRVPLPQGMDIHDVIASGRR